MRMVNISIGTKDSFLLNKVVVEVMEDHPGLEYRNYDSADLDSDPFMLAEALKAVSEADLVTMKVHGDTSFMKRFDRLLTAITGNGVCALLSCTDECVTDAYRHLFEGDDTEYEAVLTYFALGGDGNIRSMLLWALGRFDGVEAEVPPPVRPPAQGLYMPGRDDISSTRTSTLWTSRGRT